MSRGELKARVQRLLSAQDFDEAVLQLQEMPGQKVVNLLFPLLYAGDERLKMRAVRAMGAVVARLADENMEAARVIIRRFMWNLNDESGGIGWGSAEAMGEILAQHEGLAQEYAPILLSYARKDGNFQEHEMMQRGVLWGMGRLAQVKPEMVKDAVPYMAPFLESPDPLVRGHAVWVIGMTVPGAYRDDLKSLLTDDTEIQIWMDQKPITRRISDLAEEAVGLAET
ncbi:MAG: HEAT repeat domain-containing protein [Deltaproteobacteria bacterium]|nr:HEAT repeat domain-containing protein [Deltaproteobacteria bacterium]